MKNKKIIFLKKEGNKYFLNTFIDLPIKSHLTVILEKVEL